MINAEDTEEIEEDASEKTFLDQLNPNSLEIAHGYVEPNMKEAQSQDKFQFFRHGYFSVDPKLSKPGEPVFNRVVSLKSSFQLPKQ
ncbi:Glutamine--tRNA ligase [compost metagenome]